jgi:uncharacterized membrane protein
MTKPFNLLLKTSLFVFFTTGILGLYFLSIQQENSALLCAKVGGFASLVYTAITIRHVFTSSHLRISSKLVWIIALIMFQILAGIWYYLSGRSTNQNQSIHT